MSDHERIWLEPAPGADEDYGRQWCQHNVWGDEATEYVHADLHASLTSELTRLREENERLRKAPSGLPLVVTYTNYRGETAVRRILPVRVWYGSTDWHPEPQWLITAHDFDKESERDFALKDFGPVAALSPDNSTQKKEG